MIFKHILLLFIVIFTSFESTVNSQQNLPQYSVNTINGTRANPGQFPYLAFLIIEEPGNSRYGLASLISNRYLLSTAFSKFRAMSIQIILGAQNWKIEEGEQQRFTITADSIILPNVVDNEHDISILRLPRQVRFTPRIQPILLPRRSENGQKYVGTTGIISGWGPTVRGSLKEPADFITYSQVQVMDNTHCGGEIIAPSKVLCIDERWISDWENASPLVIEEPAGGLVQIALFSFVGVLPQNSSVWNLFTRLNEQLDFIEKYTNVYLRP